MKKFIAILIIVVISLPFIVAHFLKLPQEEKSKDTKVVQNKEEDLKDSLNTPNYKPKNNDFTVIDEAPPVPSDPFEDFEQETVYSEELAEKVRNRRASPFDKEPMSIIDYKPKKTGEMLYETISYRDEVNIDLPERVGDYMPVKLKFEPNLENLKNLEDFTILSPRGEEVKFNTLVRFEEKENLDTIIFEKDNDENKNVFIVYSKRNSETARVTFFVEHNKYGTFKSVIDLNSKKGYVYGMPPYSPDMEYMKNDGLIKE